MAEPEITNNENAVPVACALTLADLAAQSRRWEALVARVMTDRAETSDGLRVSFRPEPGAVEELRELAAIENKCCPWATWSVAATSDQIVLVVGSTGEGVAVLHGMFTGQRSLRRKLRLTWFELRRSVQQRIKRGPDAVKLS